MAFSFDVDRGGDYQMNPKGVRFWLIDGNSQRRFFIGQTTLENRVGRTLTTEDELLRAFDDVQDRVVLAAVRRQEADPLAEEPVHLNSADFGVG